MTFFVTSAGSGKGADVDKVREATELVRAILTLRTQKELSRARFLTDRPQTLSGPGVFARANSVAVPAIL